VDDCRKQRAHGGALAVTGRFDALPQFSSFCDPLAGNCDLNLDRDALGQQFWAPDPARLPPPARIFTEIFR
jgi:hypothetical protein